jgi:hypothetical protein
MIIVQGLEVEKFSDYYDSDDDDRKEWSYLKHYIRFNTRHGDMRCLRPNETGFSDAKAQSLKQAPGYNDECELYLWTKESLNKIEAGYPYLNEPDDLDKVVIKSPTQVSRLNDGRFSARGAMIFKFEGITYCLAIAIDGNRRAHEKYQELGRKGDKRSGIRLIDQRGTFILDAYTRKLNKLKEGLQDRPRFKVEDIECLLRNKALRLRTNTTIMGTYLYLNNLMALAMKL